MPLSHLGVVIVTFNSADVILDCIESLLSDKSQKLNIVMVDNASTDETSGVIRKWAAGELSYNASDDLPFSFSPVSKPIQLNGEVHASGHQLTLIETGVNGGFAAGVNIGLAEISTRECIDRFWILNPDSVVPPGTTKAIADHPIDAFSLMGGRVLYLGYDDRIQIDGGTVDWRTGVTGNIHLGQPHQTTPAPDPVRMDFITGASMVVSRKFYESVGPMREDYFLYYEEVDWAMRRGALPLAYCPEAVVYHRAGTAIGSPTLGRPASVFSLYFKHRARLRFMRRFRRSALAGAYMYSFAKAFQFVVKGYVKEAWVIVVASFDGHPPAAVRARLSPEAAQRAFAKSASSRS